MDVAAFFMRWLADLAADQYDNGAIPWVIPGVLSSGESGAGSAGWADAGTIIPWTLYLAYGDTRILEVQYESMQAWVAYMRAQAGDDLVWNSGFHFGDWLAYSTTNPAYPGATTGTDVIATAFFAHSTSLLAKTARVVGRESDARTYEALAADIRAAFQREFVTAAGRVAENTQTAYSLSLNFDLLARAQRPEARAAPRGGCAGAGEPSDDRLSRDTLSQRRFDAIRTSRRRVRFVVSRELPFLALSGHSGRNHDLGTLGRPKAGWLVSKSHDELVQPLRLWSRRRLDVSCRGSGSTRARPRPATSMSSSIRAPGGGLTHAAASLETMYGAVSSSWKTDGDRFELTVSIPPNTNATVRLPDGRVDTIRSGTHRFEARRN